MSWLINLNRRVFNLNSIRLIILPGVVRFTGLEGFSGYHKDFKIKPLLRLFQKKRGLGFGQKRLSLSITDSKKCCF